MATTTQARARDASAHTIALLRTAGPLAVLAAALAFFGWTALTAIAHPGPQYDEMLFVNAALGGHYAGGIFVTDRALGVVTMIMPYIGALKAWLFAPVFGLFGVSMTTIRVPAILLSGATICVAFLLARRLFGAWPAALLAVLLATDAAFVVMSKADWGPVVLSAFLRVVALAAYLAWTRTGSVRYALLLAASVVLGIFNKVDFLAFAGALAFAAVVVDHRTIVRRVRERPRALALTVAALVAVLFVEYVKIYRPARDFPAAESTANLPGRVSEVWSLFRRTMDGTGVYAYMTGDLIDVRTWVAPAVVAVVVLAGILTLWRLSPGGRRPDPADAPLADTARTTGFLFLLLLTTFAVLAATPQAIGPHHAMLMWPLPALLAVALVRAATQLRAPALRIGLTAVLTVGLLGLAGSQIRVADAYRSAFASERAWPPIWTTEAFPLASAVKRAAPGVDTIVVADWGIGNQLLALGDDDVRRRINDAWGTFAGGSQPAIDQLSFAALRGHRALVLMHRPGAEVMPETTARAEAMIERLHPARPVGVLYRGQVLLAYVVDDRPRGS
jgi:4-amino-4-deoxy-L-arabinose transferase-like glycosyltransferase